MSMRREGLRFATFVPRYTSRSTRPPTRSCLRRRRIASLKAIASPVCALVETVQVSDASIQQTKVKRCALELLYLGI